MTAHRTFKVGDRVRDDIGRQGSIFKVPNGLWVGQRHYTVTVSWDAPDKGLPLLQKRRADTVTLVKAVDG